MTPRTKLTLTFLCGLAVGTVGVKYLLGKPRSDREPAGAALGVLPQQHESLVVVKYLLEHHPDARSLRFLAWWPAVPVADNPWTHEPASQVRVVWQNRAPAAEDRIESHLFYVQGDKVLGCLNDPADGAGLRYARVRPAPGWSVGDMN
jgi:hypothetical protein